jgi:hypothetical protein
LGVLKKRNMGLLIGVGNTKPTFPYDYYYGIEWDASAASSACTRIGRTELHQTLPIQSKMRRCILNDSGVVVTYLNANNSTLTDSGAKADLSGASGQVMVEIPAHYRKFENEGTVFRCLLSEHALPGFTFVPKAYRSAYEASVDRTTATAKLASVVNTTAAFRGGNNDASKDGTFKSLLGKPATVLSLTEFRSYARNRGNAGLNNAGWNCDVYEVQKTCYWLYCVEYANFNCQLDYNAASDAHGYKQGGLGKGVSDLSNWDLFGYYPVINCGATNSLGNKTGYVEVSVAKSDDSSVAAQTMQVPSYRGLENPFGHVWSWTDGCKVRIQAASTSDFYVCTNPANFQDTDYTNYEKRGELALSSGWIKSLLVGEYGENMPLTVGGGSTTYFADYFYTSIPGSGESQRGVLFGGAADGGAYDGLAFAGTINAPSFANTLIGSRLCFLPA